MSSQAEEADLILVYIIASFITHLQRVNPFTDQAVRCLLSNNAIHTSARYKIMLKRID